MGSEIELGAQKNPPPSDMEAASDPTLVSQMVVRLTELTHNGTVTWYPDPSQHKDGMSIYTDSSSIAQLLPTETREIGFQAKVKDSQFRIIEKAQRPLAKISLSPHWNITGYTLCLVDDFGRILFKFPKVEALRGLFLAAQRSEGLTAANDAIKGVLSL